MKFSVLICTYNRHELLETALASLLVESDEKPDQVVVVNGGDDRADRVVKGFQHTARCGSDAGTNREQKPGCQPKRGTSPLPRGHHRHDR